jgi:hypothetical protein
MGSIAGVCMYMISRMQRFWGRSDQILHFPTPTMVQGYKKMLYKIELMRDRQTQKQQRKSRVSATVLNNNKYCRDDFESPYE